MEVLAKRKTKCLDELIVHRSLAPNVNIVVISNYVYRVSTLLIYLHDRFCPAFIFVGPV